MAIGAILAGLGTLAAGGASIWNVVQQNKQSGFDREQWNTAVHMDNTAVERRVADLRRAGLSPTLAAGSAAGSLQPPQAKAPQIDVAGIAQAGESMAQIAKTLADASKSRAEADRTRDLAPEQAHALRLDNALKEAMMPGLIEQLDNAIKLQGADAVLKELQARTAKMNINKGHLQIVREMLGVQSDFRGLSKQAQEVAVLSYTARIMDRNLTVSNQTGQPVGVGTSGVVGIPFAAATQALSNVDALFERAVQHMVESGKISVDRAKSLIEAMKSNKLRTY